MTICNDFDNTRTPCLHYIKTGFCSLDNHYRCIEFIRRKNPIVSYSSSSLYRKCRRAFYFSYVLGYRTTEIHLPLVAGSLIHEYLAHAHSDNVVWLRKAEASLDKLTKHYAAYGAPNDIRLIPTIMEAYRHHGFDKLKGVPEQAKTIFRDKFIVKSIVDLLVYDKEGHDYERILDYKYTGSPGFYTFFTTEHQAGLYLLQYPTVKSITYRCINKVKLRQGKAESDNDFHQRVLNDLKVRKRHYFQDKTFYRSEYNFNIIKRELQSMAEEISGNIDKDIFFYRQNRQGCYTPGMCEFLKCCESGLTPDQLPESYRRTDVEKKLDKEG